ncbi:MAG: hypothetical protein JSR37_06590 [Verrucomicrobia bacterium]|nr:hypothetical protein [Verrucomicrobiota bacterium]MBS0636477.1 hypothetical protein [Verrucomicrobiota bacterium]
MTLPAKGKPAHFKVNYQRMLAFQHLVLTITHSATDAMIHGRYRKFDAIIKNFGCQMTALDVQQKMKSKDLLREAHRVHELVLQKLEQVEAMFEKPPIGTCSMSVVDYTRHVGIDFEVTSDFRDLVIFRILNIVFDLKMEQGQEIPFTNTDPLEAMKNSSKCRVGGKFMNIGNWVHTLQVEESKKAVRFIQQFAPECEVRTASSGIMAVEQTRSVIAVMRAMRGVLIVKNKLFHCNRPIAGAIDDRVFMHMPEERIMNEEEVAELPSHEPVMVLEGYRKYKPLEETISEVGIFTILEVSLSKMAEFTSSFSQEPVKAVREVPNIEVDFRPDHIYCASVMEERDGKTA